MAVAVACNSSSSSSSSSNYRYGQKHATPHPSWQHFVPPCPAHIVHCMIGIFFTVSTFCLFFDVGAVQLGNNFATLPPLYIYMRLFFLFPSLFHWFRFLSCLIWVILMIEAFCLFHIVDAVQLGNIFPAPPPPLFICTSALPPCHCPSNPIFCNFLALIVFRGRSCHENSY